MEQLEDLLTRGGQEEEQMGQEKASASLGPIEMSSG